MLSARVFYETKKIAFAKILKQFEYDEEKDSLFYIDKRKDTIRLSSVTSGQIITRIQSKW